MQYHAPVQLAHHSREVETVSWSQDHRIAITSSEAASVLKLRGVLRSWYITSPPNLLSSEQTLKGRGTHLSPCSLPASISCSIAAKPPCPEDRSLPSVATVYDPLKDRLDFSPYLEPLLVLNHAPVNYRESGWSPAGCDVIGGCLLSVLTASGRLWLLTPPGSQAMQWQISTQLSAQIVPEKDAQLAACTTFHWLPSIILAEHGVGGVAVIAMATRSRQISVVAMEVPVYRGRGPQFHVLWEGSADGREEREGGWPCRLRWSHTSYDTWSHLAVGMTSGQLVTLSWQLPPVWKGGASGVALPQPDRRECWLQRDGMAVRHIAWQQSSASLPWVVFSKVSTLIAMQLPAMTTFNTAPYATIRGVHSRAVSGLTSLPDNQYISCTLDSSVQTFKLPSLPNQSHVSHVTPTPVTMETYTALSGDAQRTAHGVVASEHGLFTAVLTNVRSTTDAPKNRGKVCSHLHFSPLLPLSHVTIQNGNFSWDISEAIRMHTVAKQPLPSNVQSLLCSQQSSWQQLSSMVQLCLQFHMQQLVRCDGDDVSGGGGDDVISENAGGVCYDGGRGDLCEVVLMGHVCKVLVECEGREVWREEGEADGRRSLYIMSKWVESSELATPTQQHMAEKMISRLQNGMETETCPICQTCHTAIPFTSYCRETCANGHSWERCCSTLLLATNSLCGRCRGCGAAAHNILSLPLTTSRSWFERLVSRRQCTYCNGFFELVT